MSNQPSLTPKDLVRILYSILKQAGINKDGL